MSVDDQGITDSNLNCDKWRGKRLDQNGGRFAEVTKLAITTQPSVESLKRSLQYLREGILLQPDPFEEAMDVLTVGTANHRAQCHDISGTFSHFAALNLKAN